MISIPVCWCWCLAGHLRSSRQGRERQSRTGRSSSSSLLMAPLLNIKNDVHIIHVTRLEQWILIFKMFQAATAQWLHLRGTEATRGATGERERRWCQPGATHKTQWGLGWTTSRCLPSPWGFFLIYNQLCCSDSTVVRVERVHRARALRWQQLWGERGRGGLLSQLSYF